MRQLDPDTDSCNAPYQSRESEQEAAHEADRSGRPITLGDTARLTTPTARREGSQ